jgi:hypothetical protein
MGNESKEHPPDKKGPTRVFSRYITFSDKCPSCGKVMIRMVKVTEQGKETQNFMNVCDNRGCPKRANIKSLNEAGWKERKGN